MKIGLRFEQLRGFGSAERVAEPAGRVWLQNVRRRIRNLFESEIASIKAAQHLSWLQPK